MPAGIFIVFAFVFGNPLIAEKEKKFDIMFLHATGNAILRSMQMMIDLSTDDDGALIFRCLCI